MPPPPCGEEWTSRINTSASSSAISEQLAKFGLSTENVNSMLASISVLEQSRADYINEKGISQDATNAKTMALNNLNKWMARFIALAKNTLKQHPQLMESLDFVVKN